MSPTIIVKHNNGLKEDKIVKGFVNFLVEKFKIDKAKELNIVFTDDKEMEKLNQQFKHRKGPTNVLSFYGYDGDILGDIVISLDTIRREAQEQNRDFVEYLLFIISHGFLHLLGNTHETMEKFNNMIEKQNRLVEEYLNKGVEK